MAHSLVSLRSLLSFSIMRTSLTALTLQPQTLLYYFSLVLKASHYFLSLFFFFLGLHLQHMEASRLGVELELQLPAYTTICSNTGSLPTEPQEELQDLTLCYICLFIVFFLPVGMIVKCLINSSLKSMSVLWKIIHGPDTRAKQTKCQTLEPRKVCCRSKQGEWVAQKP